MLEKDWSEPQSEMEQVLGIFKGVQFKTHLTNTGVKTQMNGTSTPHFFMFCLEEQTLPQVTTIKVLHATMRSLGLSVIIG